MRGSRRSLRIHPWTRLPRRPARRSATGRRWRRDGVGSVTGSVRTKGSVGVADGVAITVAGGGAGVAARGRPWGGRRGRPWRGLRGGPGRRRGRRPDHERRQVKDRRAGEQATVGCPDDHRVGPGCRLDRRAEHRAVVVVGVLRVDRRHGRRLRAEPERHVGGPPAVAAVARARVGDANGEARARRAPGRGDRAVRQRGRPIRREGGQADHESEQQGAGECRDVRSPMPARETDMADQQGHPPGLGRKARSLRRMRRGWAGRQWYVGRTGPPRRSWPAGHGGYGMG